MLVSPAARPAARPVARPAARPAAFLLAYHIACLFLVATLSALQWVRPKRPFLALTASANRPPASLDSAKVNSGGIPGRRNWVCAKSAMLADWKRVYTDTGTCVMIACVVESTLQMVSHGYDRAVHVHLAFGLSKGLSLVLIGAVAIAQVVTSTVLLVPALYHMTGSIAPSAALGAGLWFEATLFGDLSDACTLVRTACLTCTTAMLALFRVDRAVRNAMAQLPTSGHLLQIESAVRHSCTAFRTGIVCPPCAVSLFLCTIRCNPFWHAHGIMYEWYHGRFQAGIAVVSLLFLVAGQDTRAHVIVGEKLEWLYDRCMRKGEDMLGVPRGNRHLGSKKNL